MRRFKIVKLKILDVSTNSFGDQIIRILNLTMGEVYTEVNPEGEHKPYKTGDEI